MAFGGLMTGRPDVSSRRQGLVSRQAAVVLLWSFALAITPSTAGTVALGADDWKSKRSDHETQS